MRYSLVFSPKAEENIKESILFYNSKRENLGTEFYNNLKEKLLLIQQNPLHYSVRLVGIRVSKIPRYPFLVYFKVYEKQEIITVVAVLHTSRNPKEIRKRK